MNDPLYISLINSKGCYPALAWEWVRTALDAGVTNYIIFCADDESFKELSSGGLRVKRIRPEDYPIPKIGPRANHLTKKFGKIPFLKLVALEDSLQDGGPVVFTDIDAFIQKDPSIPLKKLLRDHDVLISTVKRADAYPAFAIKRWGFSLCSGWFALKGGPPSLKFIQELKNLQGKDLQLKMNHHILKRAELSKGDDNASFQIDGVRFRLLEQSFVSRSTQPIDSYIYHCLDTPINCLHRVKKAFPSKQK
jgi:hypothetical protein